MGKNEQFEKKTLFPLERKSTLAERGDLVTFTVYLDDENKEDKMKITCPKFDTGSVEDWLEFRKAMDLVICQKNLNRDATKKFKLLRMLLSGTALEEFDSLYENLEPEVSGPDDDPTRTYDTEENYQKIMEDLTVSHIPVKFAHSTRKFLRTVRKPRNLSVEEFKKRITTVNGYLNFMPNYKGLNVPLSNEELQLCFEQGMPRNWQTALTKTGRHEEMELAEAVQYMKIMEDLEHEDIPAPARKHSAGSKHTHTGSRGMGNEKRNQGNSSGKTGNQGSGSGSVTPRRSTRFRKPYCATCKTSDHGWHECPHNPNNQKGSASEANAIEKKSKKKKNVKEATKKSTSKKRDLDESSCESESYLIEDAFVIEEEERHNEGKDNKKEEEMRRITDHVKIVLS